MPHPNPPRYAAAYKPNSEPLDQFITRKGGINEPSRQLNPSLSANRTSLCQEPPILAGKMFGEARDRAGIFGDDRSFRATSLLTMGRNSGPSLMSAACSHPSDSNPSLSAV
jgi:hypothetical protein